MILKKFYFPIFIFTVVLPTLFSSCQKQEKELAIAQYKKEQFKGYDFYNRQQYDSAIFHFYKARLACPTEDKENLSYVLYFIADIQNKQCDFTGSETTATEALRLNPDTQYKVSFYTLLGLNYQEQYDYENALKYYNLIYKEAKSIKEKMVLTNNIGYVYLESEQYSKAVHVLESIIKNDSLLQDKHNYAKILDNLGFAHLKLENPIALHYLKQALTIRDSLNNKAESIASEIHLSEYYLPRNPILAQDFAQKAYNAATEINSPDDRIEALRFLILSAGENQTKKLALLQMKISDSISKVRQTDKNQFAKIKYDSKTALQQVEKFKGQKEVLILLIILIILIFIFINYVVKNRNKRKLQSERYNTETRISKKLHDELANDVFNLMAFAETQNLQNQDKKETLLDNLDNIYTRTRNISRENSEINTNDDFEEFLKDMLSSYSSTQVNVITNQKNTINWKKIKSETKITIYRILQELMVNMKKHSHSSIVVVTFENKHNTLEINYSDNGVGCSEMLKFKKGLLNAENRILSTKGTITFETQTNKGFKAKMIIPK